MKHEEIKENERFRIPTPFFGVPSKKKYSGSQEKYKKDHQKANFRRKKRAVTEIVDPVLQKCG